MKPTRASATQHKATPRHMSAWPRRASTGTLVAIALVAIALLVAGCGGASPGSGVAHLGSSTASTGSSSSSSSSSSPSSSSSSSSSSSGEARPGSEAVAYSACMREHGVTNFPDPKVSVSGNSVRVSIRAPAGALKSNPHFKSAQQACRKLQPGGGPGPNSAPPISPKEQTQYLKAAACIRSHGIPNFPDPTFSSGGVHLPKTAGLNLQSSRVRVAEEACQSLIPGGLHGNH